ncbi:MAG: YgiQ family radical SAM protein [Oscillospiraceae bacterium]|nr:YgiQ family radical SAM protein [Oscillospiraceae bacterium]
MNRYDFLPVSREDMLDRDWYYYDFLLITGDAYVDHPSFGAAVIGRYLEAAGFRVAILAQPSFCDIEDIEAMGKPRYAALVTAGNLDSMVAHYTASKKKRSDDYYTPGKKAGKRPDRAVIVYSKLVREAFPDLPIIIGGLEASLRRFAHYDYWDDRVRRPIIVDSTADLLVYGMGESTILEIAKRLTKKERIHDITNVRGTSFVTDVAEKCKFPLVKCASFTTVSKDKSAYAKATMQQHNEQDPVRGKAIIQGCDGATVIVNPPQTTPSTVELDKIYSLPFTREVHPMYEKLGGVAAIDEVRFSVIHSRGCFGDCNFCALAFHQGKVVSSRSHESVINEVKSFVNHPEFKGYIHDVGGPTANFRRPSCKKQSTSGLCVNKKCLVPACEHLDTDHTDYFALLRKLSTIDGIKKVFVRSGIRFDFLLLDRNGDFFAELVKNHISGQLKVAPEHCVDKVLDYMGKPSNSIFEKFSEKYAKLNMRYGKKQFLVPYLIAAHPGCTIEDSIKLAEYLNKQGRQPEQVQLFYPTPGTLSTCMYYTGLDPRTMQSIHIPRSQNEKTIQRALMQWKRPSNREVVRKALIQAGRKDLIGYGKHCLIRPIANK